MSKLSKAEIITSLGLGGHFEGGYFRDTFRPTHREKVETARGPRGTMTSIYYMLTDDSPVDHFHTKHSDGIQFHHLGSPLTYHMIHPDGRCRASPSPVASGKPPNCRMASMASSAKWWRRAGKWRT